MIVARAWNLHPDQLIETDGRTWSAMLNQLHDERTDR